VIGVRETSMEGTQRLTRGTVYILDTLHPPCAVLVG